MFPHARATVLLLLLLLLLVPLVLADASVHVHHKVYHPDLPATPFAHRGTVSVSGSGPGARATLAPADTLEADLLEFSNTLRDTPGALYQVALEHPGDADSSLWHISSVKACHLPQSTSEDFILHLAPDGTPYALDYFVGPVPRDGACPRQQRRGSKKARTQSGADENAGALRHVSNSTVSLVHPSFPPLPLLRVPPPLTPEGKPVEPVPEKTFLQKYWIYFAIALVAILISSGGEEEGAGAGGARAGAGGGGRR